MKSPRVNFRLPKDQLQAVDQLIKNEVFQDRSEFFRKATEQLLQHYAEYYESVKQAVEKDE